MSKNTFKDRGFSDQKLALLASLLEKEGVPLAPRLPSWSALTPIRADGTKPPLFCMQGAGGTVLMYRDLARHLDDDKPFYGLQWQGLDGSWLVEPFVEHLASALRRSIDSNASSSGETAVNALQPRRS
jgi:hypothetical protein